MERSGAITLAVFALAILLFVTGWLAPEVTGLLAAALLVTFRVLKPDEAVQRFGSPALITLMGLFAVSAGLFRSGGLDRLRALIASDAIRSPKRMIALMVAVVAPISGFIPNTPIVATLLPVVEGWCHRRGLSPSKVLLPLSFATVLGGTISPLGTSTNLLASDVSSQIGFGPLELFSFTAIGIPVWLLGGSTCCGLPTGSCRIEGSTTAICWDPSPGRAISPRYWCRRAPSSRAIRCTTAVCSAATT